MADIKDRVKSGLDAAADTASSAADRGKQQAEGVIHQVKEDAHHAADTVEEYAGQARDFTQKAAQKVQGWTEDAYGCTSETVRDFGKDMTALVRNHPLPSLLVGFGVGLLIGRSARML